MGEREGDLRADFSSTYCPAAHGHVVDASKTDAAACHLKIKTSISPQCPFDTLHLQLHHCTVLLTGTSHFRSSSPVKVVRLKNTRLFSNGRFCRTSKEEPCQREVQTSTRYHKRASYRRASYRRASLIGVYLTGMHPYRHMQLVGVRVLIFGNF